MLTLKHLYIYQSYDGDVEGFTRSAKKWENAVMAYNDWTLIESLVQDIRLVDRNLAAAPFAMQLEIKLRDSCDGEEVVLQLKSMAKK